MAWLCAALMMHKLTSSSSGGAADFSLEGVILTFIITVASASRTVNCIRRQACGRLAAPVSVVGACQHGGTLWGVVALSCVAGATAGLLAWCTGLTVVVWATRVRCQNFKLCGGLEAPGWLLAQVASLAKVVRGILRRCPRAPLCTALIVSPCDVHSRQCGSRSLRVMSQSTSSVALSSSRRSRNSSRSMGSACLTSRLSSPCWTTCSRAP